MATEQYDWSMDRADPNDELVADIVEQTRPASAGDHPVVLLGEPFDEAVIGRKGASEAPAAIRNELAAAKTHHFTHGAIEALGDCGDLLADATGVAEIQQVCSEVARQLHRQDTFPVFLGGDNSLTYANARPLLEMDDTVCAVSLDAHLDCREPHDGPSSGTPYRQLFEAGLDHLTVCGARHFETSTVYSDFLDRQGGSIHTASAVREDLEGCIERIKDRIRQYDAAYLSLDMDVLDSATAPGVSAPTPGGLTTREGFELVSRLAALDEVQGFEIVETAPPLDRDKQTVQAASRAVAYAVAGRTA